MTTSWSNDFSSQTTWRGILNREVEEITKYLKYLRNKPKSLSNFPPALVQFCEEEKNNVVGTGPVAHFTHIHNQLIKHFEPYSTIERYMNRDSTSSYEELFKKRRIDELNKKNIYSDLMDITGVQNKYKMCEILDNRTDYIDTSIYFPYKTALEGYILGDNEQEQFFVIPKSSGFNLFVNELPFYCEKSPALTTTLVLDKSSSYSRSIITTPESSPSDNLRQVIYEVNIDAGFNSCSFEGKIQLSGQFSTITRNLYLKEGSFYPGINPKYFKKPFPTINVITDKKEEITSAQEFFPFKTEISAGFNSKDMIIHSQNTKALDLRGIINHVIWENAVLSDSVQKFYNDFKFKDVCRIKINIPPGFKLSTENESSFKIKNEYGKYEFKLMLMNEKTILIESSFFSEIDVLNEGKKYCVQEIYQAIRKISNLKINFTPQ